MKILKKILPVLILLQLPVFVEAQSIYFESRTRTYKLHVPPSYTGTTAYPLVICLHGTYGNGTQVQTQTGFTAKSDNSNFIVVYPEGVSSLGIRSWNAGACCYYAAANNINDVGFIDTLIDVLINQYNIDTNRIFATGMSNGGFMSYRLACELSNRIAAIGPVASSMSDLSGCNPAEPVPVIHVHSYDDAAVPYQGGTVANSNPPAPVIALDNVFNAWALKNNCLSPKNTIHSDNKYTHAVWTNCSCNTDVESFFTTNGAHSWAGGGGTGLDTPSQYISATDSIWAFFVKHPKNCGGATNLNETGKNELSIAVYPQPASDYINLSIGETESDDRYKAEIFNSFCQLVKSEYLNINSYNDVNTVDVKDLSAGIYFLRISNSHKNKSLKIIIQ